MAKARRPSPPAAPSRAEIAASDIDDLPDFRGVTIDRMNSFLQVYTAKGIAKAARRDPIRQSQLSRQVRELEQALDAQLFGRRGRGIEPTPAGTLLAVTIRDFVNGLARVRTAQRLPIHLAAGGSVLRWLLLPALPMPVKPGDDPCPPVRVEPGDSGAIREGLEDGSLELGVLRATDVTGPLAGTALGDVEYAWFCARSLVPIAPEATPAALGAAAPLVDIYGEPELNAMFRELGAPLMRVESFREAAELIRAGQCAGVLPLFAAQELTETEFHIVRPKAFARYASRLMLAHRRQTSAPDPELLRFQNYLRDALRDALTRARDAGRTETHAREDEPRSKSRRSARKAR
jgi:DNA-binding transcriptional LysR family regulator